MAASTAVSAPSMHAASSRSGAKSLAVRISGITRQGMRAASTFTPLGGRLAVMLVRALDRKGTPPMTGKVSRRTALRLTALAAAAPTLSQLIAAPAAHAQAQADG